jgi:hypothetical protein
MQVVTNKAPVKEEISMFISDLNHLEIVAQETGIVGGGGSNYFNVDIYVDKDIYIDEDVNIKKDFYVNSVVKGNSALAQADASASGYDTSAQAFSFTYTNPNFSSATAMSTSQSN